MINYNLLDRSTMLTKKHLVYKEIGETKPITFETDIYINLEKRNVLQTFILIFKNNNGKRTDLTIIPHSQPITPKDSIRIHKDITNNNFDDIVPDTHALHLEVINYLKKMDNNNSKGSEKGYTARNPNGYK